MNGYVCQICHELFASTWSDEEALAESKKVFGEWPQEELGIVCDECYNHVMSQFS